MTTAIPATEWLDAVEKGGMRLITDFTPRLRALWDAAPFDKRNARTKSLHVQVGLNPSDFVTPLNFRDHGEQLEREWPGCSVMWDAHPTLSQWRRYFLVITRNYVGMAPKERPNTNGLGHRKHRKLRWKMLDEARACGTHMLVGYELQPPTWKPGMIVVETKVVPSLDEDDARYVPGDPREVYEAHVVPIRAIYTARETRWTLVR